jgi:hypothetical protein
MNNERFNSLRKKIIKLVLFYLDSPPLNGNNTRKTTTSASNRSRVNYPYEKPQLRSASSSSSSPSPKTNRRVKGKISS